MRNLLGGGRYRRDEVDELCSHLRQMGIQATVVEKRRRFFGGAVMGVIKLEDRNIDTVEVVEIIHTPRPSV